MYPVKCNQDRLVVEDIVKFGSSFRFGLETGPKLELGYYFQCAKCVTKRSIVVIYLTDKSQEVQNIEIQASLQNAITDINVEDVILIEGSHVAQEPGYVDLEGEYVADDECDEEDDREEYVVNGGALVDAELEVDDVVDEAEEPDEDDEDFRDSDYEQSEDEDDNKFHKFVVPEDTEEQYKEPGEEETYEYDTEEFDSLHGSESEQENKLKLSKSLEAPRFKQYNRDHDLRDPKLCLGLEFPTVGECREALRYYANGCARMVRFEKNDTVRVKMVCNGESEEGPCPWKVYASRVKRGPTFRIKTFIECHTCGREEKAKFATSSWLAERFDEDLRRNPNMSVPYFMEMVRKHYNIDVTKDQVYKAKSFAATKIQGSIEEQYGKLWDYCHEVKVQNPGSTVLVKTKLRGDDPVFERMYICYDACRKGFIEGCRTMVGFDGCHIKGNHPGQLLSAIGIDANNGMFPIAFGIVEIENKETWTWFLDIFFKDVGILNGNGWIFITDKLKGLGLAIKNLMPDAEHRHCIRHLHSNFRSDGHGSLALKQRLGAAARATTIPTWQGEMDKILVLSESAYDWLVKRPAKNWSRSHFSIGSKCDILLNNLCECFNSKILEARDKPILIMLQRIHSYLMLRMARKREEKWHRRVGPKIVKILEKIAQESGSCIAQNAGGGKFQVTHMYGAQYAVDLNRHSCSCRKWDLCGIPCCHAMAAITRQQRSPIDYVNPAYKREAYDKAYGNFISPMPGQDLWEKLGKGRARRTRGRPTSANPRQPSETNTTSNDASQTRPLRKAKLQVGRRESLVKRGGHVAQTTRTISEGGSQHQSVMHPRGSEAVLQGQSVITGEPRRFKSAVKRARTWRP
nr:uncharacterized protein LOC108169768 [Malus domestica]